MNSGKTLDDSIYTGNEIPAIDQKTIECDLRAFTRWLNNLAEQVNYITNLYLEMKEVVKDHGYRISVLEQDLTNLTQRVDNIDARVTNLEQLVQNLIGGSGDINTALNAMNQRINLLFSWLPIPYGLIDGKGWKFAMGNISVMSDNNGTPSVDGPGIFTSGAIEDNDLYFN